MTKKRSGLDLFRQMTMADVRVRIREFERAAEAAARSARATEVEGHPAPAFPRYLYRHPRERWRAFEQVLRSEGASRVDELPDGTVRKWAGRLGFLGDDEAPLLEQWSGLPVPGSGDKEPLTRTVRLPRAPFRRS